MRSGLDDKRVAIINYGMGNRRSVSNAFEAIGARVLIADEPAQLGEATHIVLPGVGAFGDAMQNLREGGWVEPLRRLVLEERRPFLGICLGMQLLATNSTEHGVHEGLDFIPGAVERIEDAGKPLRVPHVGWNDVAFRPGSRLYAGLGDTSVFYFVHSYVFRPVDPAVVSGHCSYGPAFAASVERDNILATQYHPEKSHKVGLAVLKNFLSIQDDRHACSRHV